MRFQTIPLLVAIAVVFAPRAAMTKGSPDLITISGAGLLMPIEITDRAQLRKFDPWMGRFADWTGSHSLSAASARYDVRFYMKWDGRSMKDSYKGLALIYEFHYAPGSPGLLHLPGSGEPFHDVNVATIIRDGKDGWWIPTTPAWDALVAHALRRMPSAPPAQPILPIR